MEKEMKKKMNGLVSRQAIKELNKAVMEINADLKSDGFEPVDRKKYIRELISEAVLWDF